MGRIGGGRKGSYLNATCWAAQEPIYSAAEANSLLVLAALTYPLIPNTHLLTTKFVWKPCNLGTRELHSSLTIYLQIEFRASLTATYTSLKSIAFGILSSLEWGLYM
jgi:hypothetical protein